jgi:hypothetical protein
MAGLQGLAVLGLRECAVCAGQQCSVIVLWLQAVRGGVVRESELQEVEPD